MRLGNLSSRSSDGEFQINFRSNAFLGRLKSFQTLKAIPYSMLGQEIEFSPIDEVAKAICLLSKTNDKCLIFHPNNSHRILKMANIMAIRQKLRLIIAKSQLALDINSLATPMRMAQRPQTMSTILKMEHLPHQP